MAFYITLMLQYFYSMNQRRVDGFTLVEALVGISLGVIFIVMFVQAYLYTSATVAESRIDAAVAHIVNNNLAKHLSIDKLKQAGLRCNINRAPASGFEINIDHQKDAVSSSSIVIVSQRITAWAPYGCDNYFTVHSAVKYKKHPNAPEEWASQVAYARS